MNAKFLKLLKMRIYSKIIQSITTLTVINSESIRSPAQEPQQIIHNQDMWLEAATVSMDGEEIWLEAAVAMEDDGEPMITQNQETELEAAIVQIENGVQATEDILYDETVIVNIEPALQVEPDHQQLNFIQEPMICENQLMVLARFSDEHVIGIIAGEDDELANYRSEYVFQIPSEDPIISFESLTTHTILSKIRRWGLEFKFKFANRPLLYR
ncbi:hypothetical protein POTOM_051286 [Populus tomentosa]|uniref:Uncharacterized protein n=1 Tax=Populus tomentosa TaxID=118781 RepID=A0A8X8C6T0_POPTO|nr:hypothetical protein POTOM_051286 [Populus tomentosa]